VTELDDRSVRTLARALVRWFDAQARDLAWRRTRDPYAIWVSEIMLQQTRVETVERYWPRFIDRFPDVSSLAAAGEDEVLDQWSGLGYYRRAKLLHRGAKHVHEQLDGQVPDSAEALRSIPGIGRYTAGAIASIAFDQPAALVDGNVARVHSRLAAITQPREQDANHERHWRFVARVLEHGSPRILAQALMELGATVCTPRSPACDRCPVRRGCRAHADQSQASIPAAKLKKPPPTVHQFALALTWGDRVLFERRPEQGLLAGLWCLPLFVRDPEAAPGDQRQALVDAIKAELGVTVRLDPDPVATVAHVFSHRVWQVVPWQGSARRRPKLEGRSDGRRLMWVEGGGVPEGGVPTLTRKLLRAFEP
jgi:A/G-specific adenine glycosylase